MKVLLSLLLLLGYFETQQAREASFTPPGTEDCKTAVVSEADAKYACELLVKTDNPGSYSVTALIRGNSIVCLDSIDIPADPKAELTVICSANPTELVPDSVHGGYIQDSIEVRLRIENTGDRTVFDLDAAAIVLDNVLKTSGFPQTGKIPRLDPGAPAIELTLWLKTAPRKTDDSACVLILVTGNDSTGLPISTYECMTCIWIPKTSDITGIQRPPHAGAITLEQNRPNPFNPVTTIDYTLSTDGHVRLTVHDLLGRRVATLADEHATAGVHSVRFRSSGLPAGIYFYRLEAAGRSVIRRMMVTR